MIVLSIIKTSPNWSNTKTSITDNESPYFMKHCLNLVLSLKEHRGAGAGMEKKGKGAEEMQKVAQST